jgi:hypothetical protein
VLSTRERKEKKREREAEMENGETKHVRGEEKKQANKVGYSWSAGSTVVDISSRMFICSSVICLLDEHKVQSLTYQPDRSGAGPVPKQGNLEVISKSVDQRPA